MRRLGLVFVLGVATAVALACSSGGSEQSAEDEPSAGEDLTRTSEADGVTVEARWLTERDVSALETDLSQYPVDRFVLLELNLDTHAGDLGEIDLEEAAALRQGQAEEAPEAWVSESEDSHHRAGVLVFPRSIGAGPVELVLTVGEEAVVLVWEGPPPS